MSQCTAFHVVIINRKPTTFYCIWDLGHAGRTHKDADGRSFYGAGSVKGASDGSSS